MGVTIHYRGRLRTPAAIHPLTEELIEICKVSGWKYSQLDLSDHEPGDEPSFGLTFQPHPACENVWMLFNERGELSHPFAAAEEGEGLPWSWTKTQFAGAEAHMAICTLFRYLQKQWFEVLEVNDEAGYWETGNEQHLRDTIGYLGDAVFALTDAFSSTPLEEGETLEDRTVRLVQQFWDRRKPPGWKPSGEQEG